MAKKRDIQGERLYHFELSDHNRTVRWILVGVLVVIAIVAVALGIHSALETKAGWKLVEPTSNNINCSSDFQFQYEFGATKQSATKESKSLSMLYGQLTEKAWKLFHHDAGLSELSGLYAVNTNPNKEITVDPALYKSFQQLQASGSRVLYLGPVYEAYNEVFYATDLQTAEENNPVGNPENYEYILQLISFANNPEAVQLELRGSNKVYLKVSAEYQAFYSDAKLDRYLDFGWLCNAFIIDYMAQQLKAAGYTNGYISSLDGFTRNLDSRGTSYTLEVVSDGKPKAAMKYEKPMSVVTLRSYQLMEGNEYRYFTFSDGHTISAMIDPADGRCKMATDDLVGYATNLGCAELAMAMMPVYVADTFEEASVNGLTDKGIYCLWFDGNRLKYNQEGLQLNVANNSCTPVYVK